MTKPKCGKGQSCGNACIDIKDTCRERIDAATAALFTETVAKNLAVYKSKAVDSFAASDTGKDFDTLAAKYPFKAGTGTEEKFGKTSVWHLEMEASDGSGDKLTYSVVLAGGKSYTVSDGLIKEFTASDRNGLYKEGLAAAIRAKVEADSGQAVQAKVEASPAPAVQAVQAKVEADIKPDKSDVPLAEVETAIKAARKAFANGAGDKFEAMDRAHQVAKDYVNQVPSTAEWLDYEKSSMASAMYTAVSRGKAIPEPGATTLEFPVSNLESKPGHNVWPKMISSQADADSVALPIHRLGKPFLAKINALASQLDVSPETALLAARAAYGHTTSDDISSTTRLQILAGKGEQAEALAVLFDKGTKYEGTIYRGIRNMTEAQISELTESGEMPQNLPASWSSSEAFVASWVKSKANANTKQVMLKAKNKTGVSIKSFASPDYKDQEEVLGKPGAKYKVLSRKSLPNYELIELEEI